MKVVSAYMQVSQNGNILYNQGRATKPNIITDLERDDSHTSPGLEGMWSVKEMLGFVFIVYIFIMILVHFILISKIKHLYPFFTTLFIEHL